MLFLFLKLKFAENFEEKFKKLADLILKIKINKKNEIIKIQIKKNYK